MPTSPVLEAQASPTETAGAPTDPAYFRTTPTPDPIRPTPELRSKAVTHLVRSGDTLNKIAAQYGVAAWQIVEVNSILNPNILPVGIVLTIPAQGSLPPGPSWKLLPDSAVVYGPSSVGFDIGATLQPWQGAVLSYNEEVEDVMLTGPEIVQLVARRYSVSPRLLIVVLEHQSGWVTNGDLSLLTQAYPLGYIEAGHEGLHSQLAWAADQINAGFYSWRAGWAGPFTLADGSQIVPGPGINAGTAGVESFFARVYGDAPWRSQIGPDGFMSTYRRLFGDPFQSAIEPPVPANLEQPVLQLPIESDKEWSFTGGPHSAWGYYGAWAALDFAPPGNALGCVPSWEWVVAMADGVILRAGQGEVIQDLDGDGLEQTGWVLFYMHVDQWQRVEPGTQVRAGDRIGHPSCEGGVSNGTHVHVARKYNGEWISADGSIPFVLDRWLTVGMGVEYDGLLTRDGVTLEACSCRNDKNQISR
jgi:murein DD-endopeptidase MepM/ murein hydrolase activator NlpD